MQKNRTALQEKIGYVFKDPNLLERALSHSSYINETRSGKPSNERLEFLGDSVLSFITAEYVYGAFPALPEGELTRLRAAAVCEDSLCRFAREIGLGGSLMLGRGETATGGNERPSILADAFEALIAAIYLDAGIPAAKAFVLRFVGAFLSQRPLLSDYKTMLQEVVQKNPEETLAYVLAGSSGPDHNKIFEVEVHLNSNVIGTGRGKSKKIAEQEAAREALRLLGIVTE